MIRRLSSVRHPHFSKIFFSETAWPIKAKFYMKHLWEGGTNVFINNPGHMTKMAAMPIYGKNPSKLFFTRTTKPMSTKLDMKHQRLEDYNVLINYDHDLLYSKVNIGRSCICMGKSVKMSFERKNLQEKWKWTEDTCM